MATPRMLRVAETAFRCGVEKETVRRWINEGKLHALKLPNGYYRVREEDLESFLQPVSKGEQG